MLVSLQNECGAGDGDYIILFGVNAFLINMALLALQLFL